MNKVIDNAMLAQAFGLYEDSLAAQYAQGESFEPSDEFNKKMEKLIKSETSVYHRLTLTKARRALLIAAIILTLLAASMSVGAIREKIFSFFITGGKQVDVVEYGDESSPQTPFEAYEPSYVPEGYTLSDSGSDDSSAFYYYEKGEKFLSVEQFSADEYKSAVDAEYKTSTEENYDGIDYIVKTSDEGMTMLIFNKHNSVFEIVGFEPKDELLKLASSIG